MVGKRFEVREYPVPDPAPGTLLLRQELAGICGTDVHNWEYQRLKVDVGSLDFNPNQLLVRQNLRLEAVLGYGGTETFARALPILERNEFPFAALVDPILPLERVDDGFAALTSGYRLNGRDVIKVALRGGAGH
jgi:threonine dehydrogenase-like Zn-dependent dehydrogenase